MNHAENDGWNALHFAALSGHESSVKILLAHDINARALTNDGRFVKKKRRDEEKRGVEKSEEEKKEK